MSFVSKIGVYAGSFDPITNGHMWVINEGREYFDRLIVAVGTNPKKVGSYLFSADERLDMAKKACHGLGVDVVSMQEDFLFDFAQKNKATGLLRGVRDIGDFEYEKGLCNFHQSVNAPFTTILMIPPHNISLISSSLVKGLVGYNGWEQLVKDRVPEYVAQKMFDRFT